VVPERGLHAEYLVGERPGRRVRLDPDRAARRDDLQPGRVARLARLARELGEDAVGADAPAAPGAGEVRGGERKDR
jgi:hypothetical protein